MVDYARPVPFRIYLGEAISYHTFSNYFPRSILKYSINNWMSRRCFLPKPLPNFETTSQPCPAQSFDSIRCVSAITTPVSISWMKFALKMHETQPRREYSQNISIALRGRWMLVRLLFIYSRIAIWYCWKSTTGLRTEVTLSVNGEARCEYMRIAKCLLFEIPLLTCSQYPQHNRTNNKTRNNSRNGRIKL